jgi:hypothetical protein
MRTNRGSTATQPTANNWPIPNYVGATRATYAVTFGKRSATEPTDIQQLADPDFVGPRGGA